MKVAICDDKKIYLDLLERNISQELNKHEVDYKILTYLTGEAFMAHHMQNPFDVVFLDIIMPDVDGFEIAKQIRKISSNTYVIFVTTESYLVYDSFDFKPFNFISKSSVDNLHKRVEHVIERLVKDIDNNQPVCFKLAYGEIVYVSPRDIIYARSKGNYVIFEINEAKPVTLRRKISDALQMLPQTQFARIHNRTIVNMCHITKIDYPNLTVILDDGSKLDISRPYRTALSEAYSIFLRDYN